jgi:hypothetical protein
VPKSNYETVFHFQLKRKKISASRTYPIKDSRPDFRDFLTTLSGISLIFCKELLVPPPEFRLLGGPPPEFLLPAVNSLPSDFLRSGMFTESEKENE